MRERVSELLIKLFLIITTSRFSKESLANVYN